MLGNQGAPPNVNTVSPFIAVSCFYARMATRISQELGHLLVVLLDAYGKDLLDGPVDTIEAGADAFKASRQGRWALLDKTGKILIGFELMDKASIVPASMGWFGRKKSGLGLVDPTGKTLMPFEYEARGDPKNYPFTSPAQALWTLRHLPTEKTGVMDATLSWLLRPGIYDDIRAPQETGDVPDMIAVSRGGKDGIFSLREKREIMATGHAAVALQRDFARIWATEDSLSQVFVFATRTWHAAPNYSYISYDSRCKRFVVASKTQSGLADAAGKLVFESDLDAIMPATADGQEPFLFAVRKDDREGFIDCDGRFVIPLVYDAHFASANKRDYRPTIFVNGTAHVTKQGMGLLIDRKNKVLASLAQLQLQTPEASIGKRRIGNFTAIHAHTSGRFAKQTFSMLHHGQVYTELGGNFGKRDAGLAPSEGLLAAKRDGKFAYLDLQGKEVIAAQFDRASEFAAGVAYVEKDGKVFIINRFGTELAHVDPDLLLKRAGK